MHGGRGSVWVSGSWLPPFSLVPTPASDDFYSERRSAPFPTPDPFAGLQWNSMAQAWRDRLNITDPQMRENAPHRTHVGRAWIIRDRQRKVTPPLRPRAAERHHGGASNSASPSVRANDRARSCERERTRRGDSSESLAALAAAARCQARSDPRPLRWPSNLRRPVPPLPPLPPLNAQLPDDSTFTEQNPPLHPTDLTSFSDPVRPASSAFCHVLPRARASDGRMQDADGRLHRSGSRLSTTERRKCLSESAAGLDLIRLPSFLAALRFARRSHGNEA